MKIRSSFTFYALGFLLISACSDDFLLSRATSDYFPLKSKMEWTYAKNGESVYVAVKGDSNAYGHFATVVERNFIEEYWIKGRGEVKKFIAFDTLILGDWDTIEMGYKLYYKFPLLNNATWGEKRLDTVVIAGDSFRHNYTMKAVCFLVDTLRFGANFYSDVYKIEFSCERELIGLRDAKRHLIKRNWVEFLAPQVGVVRREEGGEVEVLTSFRPNR